MLRFCGRYETLYGATAVTPNIHLHAHLTACILDYGPMSSFLLFSFERYNGLLVDEPTNNRSMELQLINRFIKDNAHLHLLSSIPSDSIGATSVLSRAVIEHVSKLSSTMHLNSVSYHLPSETDFVAGSKYTIASFSSFDMHILSNV